ncbi:hypothetical protein NM680_06200 [Paracoccus sp. PS-1]|uniref:hypothetical protein n=1 Tax=Paracoccus sp. PS1 TaxID=2963938 RepID=UPI0027E51BD8|nr:hypothetical protein [Paracoccus sp. PS1]MDQ7261390.1 hypothetical protein [Paracoccus sp. PS1]
MRFLLTFHCVATGQWRCLDTALLPDLRSGRAEDLPAALRGEPDLVIIYALGANRSVIGFENAYNGAWLEMFLLENQPLGHIAIRKVFSLSGAMAKLEERAARPLHPSDAACRLTVSRIIEHRQILGKQYKTDAGRTAAFVEKV